MKFNFGTFTEWKQDNRDYSNVSTKREYLAHIGQDIIEYCLDELEMSKMRAYETSDKYFRIEADRLGIELWA